MVVSQHSVITSKSSGLRGAKARPTSKTSTQRANTQALVGVSPVAISALCARCFGSKSAHSIPMTLIQSCTFNFYLSRLLAHILDSSRVGQCAPLCRPTTQLLRRNPSSARCSMRLGVLRRSHSLRTGS
jgi:hypothetical protein